MDFTSVEDIPAMSRLTDCILLIVGVYKISIAQFIHFDWNFWPELANPTAANNGKELDHSKVNFKEGPSSS